MKLERGGKFLTCTEISISRSFCNANNASAGTITAYTE